MAAQAAEWEAAADGRAVFLDCYARMTGAVQQADEAGRFDDPAWVAALLDRFAEYYFASIDGGAGGVDVPEPWVVAHAAAVGHDASPLQLLLAGVNAHINYDLVLTLVDLLEPEWVGLDDVGRDRRRTDYDRINEVIAETADLVQDLVLERRSPWLESLDRGLGRWDERAAVRLLSGWRSRVWRHAMDVMAETGPSARAARIGEIERQCARRGRWLLV